MMPRLIIMDVSSELWIGNYQGGGKSPPWQLSGVVSAGAGLLHVIRSGRAVQAAAGIRGTQRRVERRCQGAGRLVASSADAEECAILGQRLIRGGLHVAQCAQFDV